MPQGPEFNTIVILFPVWARLPPANQSSCFPRFQFDKKIFLLGWNRAGPGSAGWLWFRAHLKWKLIKRLVIAIHLFYLLQLPAALISVLLYESFVIPSFFGLFLLHMQPGIIAGDEVKYNLSHDAILKFCFVAFNHIRLSRRVDGSRCMISMVKGVDCQPLSPVCLHDCWSVELL